ncbi:MAG: NAD(P)-binding protein [Clostridiales Family XIII bacterium]|jgi:Fe-S oxidoreductase|nr:NAD(P)-binding protein [Clostridiales Family XIII bacterium]
MEDFLEKFSDCLQKEAPFCATECPFRYDVLDFIDKMRKGLFNAAFRLYRNATGFPHIAAGLCRAPCEGVCPMGGAGGAISLRLLERACLDFAKDKRAAGYNLPAKGKRVAILGAGPSGMACALRLSAKKYGVEVFEGSGRMGGRLWDFMEPEIFLGDFREQLRNEEYALRLDSPVRGRDELDGMGFDAVYVATGAGGAGFGLLDAGAGGAGSLVYGGVGWFAGGALVGSGGARALSDGLAAATAIDSYLKTGNLPGPRVDAATRMILEPSRLVQAPAVVPENGLSFSEGEARREADRCLKCRCDACRIYCDLTEFTDKWPLRIRDEIVATTLPGASEVKATPAKRLMSASNLAGICKEVCPAGIDLEGLILAGRQSMHRQGKAPWAFHDFWIRDMEFSNGDGAALCMPPPGRDSCAYAFFPGCQLGAGDPLLVERAYGALLRARPDTGLLIRCCGAPAGWAGDVHRHGEAVAGIQAEWERLGRPTLIAACPSCMLELGRYAPQLPLRSLYETLHEWGAAARLEAAGPVGEGPYAVFDPCAARHDAGAKSAVRALAEGAGCALRPLAGQERVTRCCGYGGQPGVASPEYASFVARKRAGESGLPYIAYCVNCRDAFVKEGKECVHILELLFGDGGGMARPATASERRRNRSDLRRGLLDRLWGVSVRQEGPDDPGGLDIRMGEGLLARMDEDRILEDEVRSVVEFCQRTGRRTYDGEKGTFSGYRKIGHMSYWVEYRLAGAEGAIEALNAYSHRMEIELEAVWNGVRTQPDL